MSDPPVQPQAEEAVPDQRSPEVEVDGDGEGELEHITDGYYRVTEVLFNWVPFLDPWQANPVMALINQNSLIHPDHPLREKDQDAFRLFNCLQHDGHEYLCFSLKQLEYLQYYIHEMRLADPAWTNYLAKLGSGNEEDQPKEGEIIPEPPYVEEDNSWIPLPGGIIDGKLIAEVEMVLFYEPKAMKKMINQQKKFNVQVDRKLADRSVLSSEAKAKVEAYEENTAPGPGLRRGPAKIRERRKPETEREEGTGWGGFPTKAAGDEEERVPMEKPDHVAWQEEASDAVPIPAEKADANASEAVTGDTTPAVIIAKPDVGITVAAEPEPPATNASHVPDAAQTAKPANGTDHTPAEDEDDIDPRPDALAEQLNKLVDLRAKIDSETPAEPAPEVDEENETPKVEDPIVRYFYDAQQAFVLASAGGLATALAQKLAEDKAARVAEEGEEEEEEPEIPAEIGRSLFFALELTTWEEDENVVLEVGWAATWFQEKLDIEKGEAAKADGAEEDEGKYERMTEHGHIIVQDHLLDKRNGKTKPDHRSSYTFGNSTPLPAKDVQRTLSQKLKDLSKRAGSGPIYLLLHSANTDESDFKKLGWKTGGWEKQIRPAEWEYPSYASPDGFGKVFLIDTAKLFGAIEDDKTILPQTGKTRKPLEVVAGIMFGSDPERAPKACGNAGNHAAYCLLIFLAIVDGLPLEVLRADYQQSQVPIVVDPALEADEEDGPSTILPATNGDTPSVAPTTEPTPLQSRDAEYTKAMAIKGNPTPVKANGKADKPTDGASESRDVKPAAIDKPAGVNGGGEEPAEDEEDSEDEGIRGVYWEDRNGNVVELSV